MWNDLSAYLCGCVDPVDESPRHVHLTREYDDDRADATSREILAAIRPTQVAPAPDDSSESELEDVRSPRPAFVRQKSIAAARVPPIPLVDAGGAPLPPPPTPAVATDVSDVAVVRPDGRGVFGALRLGVERSTRQLVSVEDVEGEVQALRRAARAAACPQLVAVHGIGPAPKGGVRVVTEYLDGGSLRDIAVKKDGLAGDETVLLHIAGEALKGLAFLHARQLTHGAVAPASIRLGRDGRVKLAGAGFGLDGPAQYQAPELKGKARKTPEGDVWALGQALFAAASGRFCARQLGGEPKLDAPYSADAAALVLHASRRDPELRATAMFLLDAPCLTLREWPFPPSLSAAVTTALGPPAETDEDRMALVERAVAAPPPTREGSKKFLDEVFDK